MLIISNIQNCRFETKPWITPGLANSIKIKNDFCKSFCKEKDPHKKENYERQFKTYHNLISTLPREIKESYTLETTKKTLKLVWQTIKGIINMDNKSDESISNLLIDNRLITSTKLISNHFNIFFTSIAEKITLSKQKISSFISWP